jgi:hypothetical protein
MNIDHFITPSILHVTASTILDVTEDLKAVETKTIGQLLSDNEKEKTKINEEKSEQN